MTNPLSAKKIQIMIELETTKLRNRIRGFKSQITQLKGQIAELNTKMKEMNATMKKNKSSFKEGGDSMAAWLGVGLSVMFLSQAISAALTSMMQPVFEMTGLFEVWRATMISVLGPVLIPLSLVLIKIMTWFMKLPKPFKIVIGSFVLLLAVIFKLLAAGSQLYLLFKSLEMMFGAGVITKWVAALWTSIKGLSLFTGPIECVLIRLFTGLTAMIWGVWRIFKGFAESNMWKILSGVLLVIVGLIVLLCGGWIPVLIAGIVMLFVWLGDKFGYVKAVILSIISPLANVWDILRGIWGLLSGKGLSMFDWKTSKATYGEIGEGWAAGWGSGEKVQKLAAGGIVRRPTLAMIGESGPEAVVPLDGSSMGDININISGSFSGSPEQVARAVQGAMRDELRRLGVR